MPFVESHPKDNARDLASRLTLVVPDGVVAITMHYPDEYDNLYIKLQRERRGDGHDHFVRENGFAIPLDVPAVINVIRELEQVPSFYVSAQDLNKATEAVKTEYLRRRARKEPFQEMTLAREAVMRLCPSLPPKILLQSADTIRKRLRKWKGRRKRVAENIFPVQPQSM